MNEVANNEFVVTIKCLAYNHESYIRECLEGFVMQKTNFKFVAIVHDDASTDKTADIIREYEAKYPEIIKPIYETENQYSKHDGTLDRIMESAIDVTGAKYVALCEGDDYWTDPFKLQKQVDYMESHEECGLCYTDYSVCDDNTGVVSCNYYENGLNTPILSFKDMLFSQGYMAPMTWLSRRKIWNEVTNDVPRNLTDGTYAYALNFFAKSKVAYLPFTTATYRSHNNSASRPNSLVGLFNYRKGVFDSQALYAEKYLKNSNIQYLLKRLEIEELLPIAAKINNADYIRECESFSKHNFNLYFKAYDYIAVERELSQIKKSVAYRVGKAIVRPFSKIRKILLGIG